MKVMASVKQRKSLAMKPAAIYARVSSERQKTEDTIQSQVAALREHAQSEGYAVPEEWIFLDEGYSGAMLVRPGLERLRDLASEGQLDIVLIFSPDRLSRKYAYQVLLLEELSRHGVDVVFLKSARATTPEEELMLQFQGMIAEYERAQIAERTRRGKKHRARAGSINVLSGAPYGYRYVKKTDSTSASYEIIAMEAEIVRTVFRLYLEEALSINAIARWLNDRQVPTRKGISCWERSTIWAMLRNPAYRGAACFGKTERAERQRITRPLRSKGGFSPRCSSNRERRREEWVEIPVPSIIEEETFALAQERLEQNKRLSPRRTIEPTLLQSMLVCGECGYAFYRTSTRTSRKKLYYYRCLGSDDYRYPNGRVCHNRPVRQDYLDEIVWKEVLRLLGDPDLIRSEIERRLKEIQQSNPTKRKKDVLSKEIVRIRKAIEKLLDAYQEDLLQLDELRQRMPELRKREKALYEELQSLEAAAVDQRTFLRLAGTMESFLERLRSTAETLDVKERQRVLRLVVKEVLVDRETIRIKHSIPVMQGNDPPPKLAVASSAPGYLLRSWSHISSSGQYLPSRI
jgi:site-specific DNA recombinase